MDTFVHKKPRLDLAVSGVGCGSGMATHEPETERSDASEQYIVVLPHHVCQKCELPKPSLALGYYLRQGMKNCMTM